MDELRWLWDHGVFGIDVSTLELLGALAGAAALPFFRWLFAAPEESCNARSADRSDSEPSQEKP